MKCKVLMVVLCVMLVMCGCSPETSTDVSTDNAVTESQESMEQVLIDNDNVKVTFKELYEEDSVPDTCYVRLDVENKSGKKVTVYPEETYVNDMAAMLCSGVPMVLDVDKSSQTPFFFTYKNLNIKSKDEIEKIEFKLRLEDEDYNSVFESDELIINLK